MAATPASIVSTPLNSPVWTDIHLHGIGSAYQADLDKLGYPGGTSRDFSQLIESCTLSETAGEAAMKLEVTLRDTTDPNHPTLRSIGLPNQHTHATESALAPLTVGTELHLYGYTLNTMLGGTRSADPVRLFRGQVYLAPTSTTPSSHTRSFTAYDPATLLARTEAPLVFHNDTYTQVFKHVCKLYGFTYNIALDTKTPLGKIVMGPGWSLWKLFQECGKRHYEKTGETFYVRSRPDEQRHIDLLNFGDFAGSEGTGITWHIGDGPHGALTDYTYTDSAEELATRIVLMQEQYDDQGNFKALAQMREGIVIGPLRETFGDLLKILAPDASIEPLLPQGTPEWTKIQAQMAAQMKQALKNFGRTKKSASLRSVYIPGIRRGDRITAGVGSVHQRGWIVDSVSTTWSPSGVDQTIDIVQLQIDSSVGIV